MIVFQLATVLATLDTPAIVKLPREFVSARRTFGAMRSVLPALSDSTTTTMAANPVTAMRMEQSKSKLVPGLIFLQSYEYKNHKISWKSFHF